MISLIRRSAIRLLMAAVSATGLLAVAYVLLVHTGAGIRFVTESFQYSTGRSDRPFGFIDGQLAAVNSHDLKGALLLIFCIALARGNPVLAVAGVFSTGGAVVAAHVVRYYRPAGGVFGPAGFVGSTFPSGHTTTAAACGMGLVLVSPRLLRGVAALVAAAGSFMVATQVQALSWHTIIDVIGGSLIPYAFVTLTAAALAALRRRRAPVPDSHLPSAVILALVGVVAVAVGLLALSSGDGPHNAYVFSLAVPIGLMGLLYSSLLLLTRDGACEPDLLTFHLWRRVQGAAVAR